MKHEYKVSKIDNENTRSLSVYCKVGVMLAVAETSQIPNEDCESPYYFNRLNVPKTLRGQGIGKELLRRLCLEADKHNIDILCHVNPETGMNFKRLVNLYLSFGFKKGSSVHELFRKHSFS